MGYDSERETEHFTVTNPRSQGKWQHWDLKLSLFMPKGFLLKAIFSTALVLVLNSFAG